MSYSTTTPFAPIYAQIAPLLNSMYQCADNMWALYGQMTALDTLIDKLKDEIDDQLSRYGI
jgi:hypothetical protein